KARFPYRFPGCEAADFPGRVAPGFTKEKARRRPGFFKDGAPYEIRTRVLALRGPRPRPLDEGSGVVRGGPRLDGRSPWTAGPCTRLGSIWAAPAAGNALCTRPAVRRLPAAQPLPMPIQEPSNTDGAPLSLRVIPRDGHTISRKDISPNALRVLYRLRDAGFGAYLVGGAVRDLL